MDCLIEKENIKIELSSLDILVTDFNDSSPSLRVSQRTINNRSGFVFNNATHASKAIEVSGKFICPSAYELEEKKDEINGLFSNEEPFYITKMLPSGSLYEFELPGQSEGFELVGVPTERYKYRYKVINDSEIKYDFVGKSSAGLLMEFTVSMTTAELPYGETIPKNEEITSHFIDYKGTARCSQLEWPWVVKLTATAVSQSGKFSLTIGDRTFESYSPTTINKGDMFLLKGFETLKNYSNFNDSTNYEHFVLKPYPKNKVPIDTSFVGKIEILNKTYLYK